MKNINLNKKKFLNFFKIFLKRKNKHTLIRKLNPTSNEKKLSSPNFCSILKKKTHINLFFLHCMEKNNKRKEKKFKCWVLLVVRPNQIESYYWVWLRSKIQYPWLP
jgi:hypothetical protein